MMADPKIKSYHANELDVPLEERYQVPIQGRMLGFLYENVPLQVGINPLLALTIAWLFWDIHSHTTLTIWLIIVSFAFSLRYILYRRYLHVNPPDEDVQGWILGFALTMVFAGLVWGYAGFSYFSLENPNQTMVLVIIIAGLTAGSFVSHSSIYLTYLIFPVFAVIPLSIRFFMVGSVEHSVVGVICIVFMLTLMSHAKKAHRYLRQSVAMECWMKDVRDELDEKKREAERANIAKSKFLAAASHDLRQPVHAIQIFAEVLEGRLSGSKEIGIINNILKATDSLENLFTNLLDISKVDAMAITPEPKTFAINRLLLHLRDQYETQAWDKGLDYRTVETKLAVNTDPIILERILANLVNNAIRYTDRGAILVGCRRKKESVSIQVWDSGIGIPLGKVDQIFTEFYQVGNPERDQAKGLGLGLAIVKGLAGILGINIIAHSTEGKGSCFAVELPYVENNNLSLAEEIETAVSSDAMLGKLVVFIDDEQTIRDAMTHLFDNWGCQGIIAEDIGQAEMQLADRSLPPDLIIADYRLRENQTGISAIKQIRERYGPDIPAIIITGDTAPDRLLEASSYGALLLHKPIKPSVLYRMMEELVTSSGKGAA